MRILSAAAIAFIITGLAGAAETPAAPVSATQAEQEGAPIGTPVQTAGKITSLHNAALVGVSDPHIVVKLETAEGDTEIVDLGSTSELKTNGIEPKQGQQLWVDGRVGKINDKFLIVAEKLSETKLVTIARTAPLREETVKHAEARTDSSADAKTASSNDPKAPKTETVDAGQHIRTVEGTVLHTRHIKIEGEADEHALVKIQTENGIAVIDLGNCNTTPKTVNLSDGQFLAASGSVGQLNGKPIILADSVGNLSPIQRTAELRTSPATTIPVNK